MAANQLPPEAWGAIGTIITGIFALLKRNIDLNKGKADEQYRRIMRDIELINNCSSKDCPYKSEEK